MHTTPIKQEDSLAKPTSKSNYLSFSAQSTDLSMKIQKIPLRQRIDLTEQTLMSQTVKRIEARSWKISEAM